MPHFSCLPGFWGVLAELSRMAQFLSELIFLCYGYCLNHSMPQSFCRPHISESVSTFYNEYHRAFVFGCGDGAGVVEISSTIFLLYGFSRFSKIVIRTNVFIYPCTVHLMEYEAH